MNKAEKILPVLTAAVIPLYYLFFYTPYGMDTTDFGYFYGYAWRILQGQIPYRDFFYIKPALPLYWHAFWMQLTPEKWQVLAGKAGYLAEMLALSWFTALYFAKIFDLNKLELPTTLLATCGFIFSVHTFPHMPWHTADGAFFCALSLWSAISGHSLLAGVAVACASLCKQSFILMPCAIFILLWIMRKRNCILFTVGFLGVIAAFAAFLYFKGAWPAFREMTTGQLDLREAIDAGILIYLRQNWLLPLAACAPALICKLCKKPLPKAIAPACCYIVLLAICYIGLCLTEQTWIGFGLSWPTLFMILGGACVILPQIFLTPITKITTNYPRMAPAAGLGAALLAAWSCAISGGYKIPAFFATPLVFSFFIFHARFYGNARQLAWLTLAAGLLMFGIGYQYPYVFPQRPLTANELIHDAGAVYPRASGVKVDADMLARLQELKNLREKYGANYKTLPGFTLAFYLNNDAPTLSSDWLIDWEINGKTNQVYQELVDKKITVFMERDQLDVLKADNYDRAGYTVPQMVRRHWRIIEETPHFVIFQPPAGQD